jgi:MoaA/NifB/PqqE/SkfB family radical SAM enzyme
MSITITNRCNLVCKMCTIILEDKHTLPEELAMHAADFAERRGFKEVEIGGGEPTLVKYFWKLAERICEIDGLEKKVVTNGLKHTDDMVKRFADLPDLHVQVSIDGLDENHDRIRGAQGALQRSERSLYALAEAGVPLSVNTVVQRSNFREMVDVYERFKPLPLKFHAFSLIEGRDHAEDEYLQPEDGPELIRVLREVQQRAMAEGHEVVLSDELLKAYQLRVQYPHFLMHPGYNCSVVRKGLLITQDGYALPCQHYLGWDKSDARSLHTRTLDEIVDSPEIIDELKRAIGLNGCYGCSTMCYNWDEEFRRKVMTPEGTDKLRRSWAVGKEYVKENYPGVAQAYRHVKRLIPS